jgi:hypothetical protein
MGLFDGMFKSDSQIDNEYRLHMERLQIEQAMVQMKQAELRRIDAAQQHFSNQGMLGTSGNAMAFRTPPPRFDPNKSEAFQIPLSQAVTMWKLKFGDNWYDAHQARPPAGKDFYDDVFGRINNAGLFESTDGWYRLKEDV